MKNKFHLEDDIMMRVINEINGYCFYSLNYKKKTRKNKRKNPDLIIFIESRWINIKHKLFINIIYTVSINIQLVFQIDFFDFLSFMEHQKRCVHVQYSIFDGDHSAKCLIL